IIDVRDVDHQRDLIARVGEKAFDRVEDDWADHVADVARFVDRRSADVHADFARLDRLERLLLASQSVVGTQGHRIPRKHPGRRPGLTVDQNGGLAADRFGAADDADSFAGLALDIHRLHVKSQELGEITADVCFYRPELWLLGENNDVYVHQPPAFARQARQR